MGLSCCLKSCEFINVLAALAENPGSGSSTFLVNQQPPATIVAICDVLRQCIHVVHIYTHGLSIYTHKISREGEIEYIPWVDWGGMGWEQGGESAGRGAWNWGILEVV